MQTVHYIYFYDRFDTIQKIEFSKAFDMWVNHHGGKRQFLESLRKSQNNSLLMLNIVLTFSEYFENTFDAKYVMDHPDINQEYLYDMEFFNMYIMRVADDYNNRIIQPSNIITPIIIGLAILGLVSMCN